MEPESRYPRFLKEAIIRAAQENDSHHASPPTRSPKLVMTAAIHDAASSASPTAGPLADKTPGVPQTPQTHDFAASRPTTDTDSARFGGFGGKPAPPWFRFPYPTPLPWAVENPVRARKRRSRRKSQSRWPLGPDETARMPDACAILGLSEGSIRNRYNPKSPYYNATFPPPKRLGGISSRRGAIGWRAGDIYAWRDAQLSSK